ncbi:uncharacterized protein NECHADRAFT_89044 [Fusarium vanettenii 77-13-4]|uniref:Uncharacterized protein n=1 Tax=Fusarium vanettenii (strain ATCC MYA-4622 / CBS 123669 / FGSC 9596 / NRRL 45880 / 77-13-4) TaxID=660122 RepID=C7ZPZ9_FUSV7|nr:uncharacterized protein NECHADRAFT_89044 [Fusarium vanettenii 77-13-4]EEU33914.1 predicted protein [Fusarium vanettenii 77-13-4]
MGRITGSDDAQRQFNGKFLEELRTNSSKRMAWTAQDRVAMLKWLANGRHSKDTLREDEKSLSNLAVSIGIEPAKLHKKHRIVLKRKMLSSMEYTLQTLKNEGKVSECWDPSTRKKRLRWPEALVSEILGETSTLSSALERILRESTPEEEVAPSGHNREETTAANPKTPTQPIAGTTEPIVIDDDDDDDDDDFLDSEGDIEMGGITTSLAKTVLSNEVRDGKARADFDAGEMKEALRRSMQDEITRLQQLIQDQSHQRQNLHNVQFPRPPSHQPQAHAPSKKEDERRQAAEQLASIEQLASRERDQIQLKMKQEQERREAELRAREEAIKQHQQDLEAQRATAKLEEAELAKAEAEAEMMRQMREDAWEQELEEKTQEMEQEKRRHLIQQFLQRQQDQHQPSDDTQNPEGQQNTSPPPPSPPPAHPQREMRPFPEYTAPSSRRRIPSSLKGSIFADNNNNNKSPDLEADRKRLEALLASPSVMPAAPRGEEQRHERMAAAQVHPDSTNVFHSFWGNVPNPAPSPNVLVSSVKGATNTFSVPDADSEWESHTGSDPGESNAGSLDEYVTPRATPRPSTVGLFPFGVPPMGPLRSAREADVQNAQGKGKEVEPASHSLPVPPPAISLLGKSSDDVQRDDDEFGRSGDASLDQISIVSSPGPPSPTVPTTLPFQFKPGSFAMDRFATSDNVPGPSTHGEWPARLGSESAKETHFVPPQHSAWDGFWQSHGPIFRQPSTIEDEDERGDEDETDETSSHDSEPLPETKYLMNANSTLGMLQQPMTAQDLEARQAIMHRLIDMAADNRIWGGQQMTP